jgi:hypothetical protein
MGGPDAGRGERDLSGSAVDEQGLHGLQGCERVQSKDRDKVGHQRTPHTVLEFLRGTGSTDGVAPHASGSGGFHRR